MFKYKKEIRDLQMQIASIKVIIQDMRCKHDGNFWFRREGNTFKKECAECGKLSDTTMEEYYELKVYEAKNKVKDAQQELENLKREIEEYAKKSVVESKE
jgi:hypothetical protein